jgi:hypothetical protein
LLVLLQPSLLGFAVVVLEGAEAEGFETGAEDAGREVLLLLVPLHDSDLEGVRVVVELADGLLELAEGLLVLTLGRLEEGLLVEVRVVVLARTLLSYPVPAKMFAKANANAARKYLVLLIVFVSYCLCDVLEYSHSLNSGGQFTFAGGTVLGSRI